jgi:hypothetical protein
MTDRAKVLTDEQCDALLKEAIAPWQTSSGTGAVDMYRALIRSAYAAGFGRLLTPNHPSDDRWIADLTNEQTHRHRKFG